MMNRGEPARYYQSLNRPILILGMDRSLFFLLVGLTLPIAFSAHLAPSMDILALGFFSIGYLVTWLATKDDPQILSLWRRYLRYYPHYAAQPDLVSKQFAPEPSVPVYQSNRR
jgi:type IV secretory pathway TrbD component